MAMMKKQQKIFFLIRVNNSCYKIQIGKYKKLLALGLRLQPHLAFKRTRLNNSNRQTF
jgi:hypothetical protein